MIFGRCFLFRIETQLAILCWVPFADSSCVNVFIQLVAAAWVSLVNRLGTADIRRCRFSIQPGFYFPLRPIQR